MTLEATAMVMLLVLGPAGSATAQDLRGTLKKIKDTGSIAIAYRESSPPLSSAAPSSAAPGGRKAVGYTDEPDGLMMRRDDSAFRLEVNRAGSEVYRSGDIAATCQEWFGAFAKPGPLLLAMHLLQSLPE